MITILCNKCGHAVNDDAKFCNKCGASILDETNTESMILENQGTDKVDSFEDEATVRIDSIQNESTVSLKNKSSKAFILWGVLGGLLLALVGGGIYFAAIMFNDKITAADFDTQFYPQVSFSLELSNNMADKFKTENIKIIEDNNSAELNSIVKINETKYKITYTTKYFDYDERSINFKINIFNGDKSIEEEFSYQSPKLPKWEISIKDVDSYEYPVIGMKLSIKDINSSPVKSFNIDKLEISEGDNKIKPLLINELGNFEYELAYETQSELRARVQVPFEVQATINKLDAVGSGSFIPAPLDNLEFEIKQIDTYNYPKIKLYFQAYDILNNSSPKDLRKDFFYLGEMDKSGNYINQQINEVVQLNENEALNISLVADVSDSMSYGMLDAAKQTIIDFAQTIQFNAGDKLELLAFSDNVYSVVDFTDDATKIARNTSYLSTSGLTCLYDALYTAVNRTVLQEGAKCVIAFTDGEDNISYNTPNSVIALANRYQIPIFIVGVGAYVEEWTLKNIAESTGGFYRNINYFYDIKEIYNSIYRKQKEFYVLEYTIPNPEEDYARNIRLEYQANNYGGTSKYQYQPRLIFGMDNTSSAVTGVDLAIGNYLRGFVKAINANNFSYLQDYIETGSKLYTTQKKYVETKKVQEQLLSFEVISKNYLDNELCDVVVRETYQIQNFSEPIHIKSFENTYTCRKQPNGTWLPIDLKELIVIGKTY